MDFYDIRVEHKDRPSRIEIYPEFIVDSDGSTDLMIRGGDFYAVWNEQEKMWSQNSKYIQKVIDAELAQKKEEVANTPYGERTKIVVRRMRDYSSGSWEKFLKYISSLPDDYHQLDEKIIFQDTVTKKTDYASHRLPYSLHDGDISAYEEIMSTLYEPEERQKIEWAIGSILCGDSKKIQKFIVFHGPMGTGKSTVMNLIEKLFGGYRRQGGYCAKINAQALVGGNVGFALSPFASSPLVGIDQDSKLSRIEDNTILNQIVSHDTLEINEKFKALYESSASCFLFMGTNEPVRITNAKSGIIRRLIDVEPTGKLISPESRYNKLVGQMDFELGAIAKHCLDVYKSMGKTYYSKYVPKRMMLRTDPFYNFMLDNYELFSKNEGITAQNLWAMYKTWCNDSGMEYTFKRFQMVDEAKNYFKYFEERAKVGDSFVRNWYSGFKIEKFQKGAPDLSGKEEEQSNESFICPDWLKMKKQHSLLDDVLADCPAQYGDEKPKLYWRDVETKLKDLDTSKTHYVQPDCHLIFIDGDKKNAKGEKDFTENVKAVIRLGLPPTYAEKSKGGQGLHLAYFYDGDPEALSRLIEEDIEVKVQVGDSAMRRRVSECNAEPVAHISSGLPLKKKKAVINDFALKDERHLRNKIMMALRKEVEPKATRTSMMYIRDCLKEAQEKNIAYDFSQLDTMIYSFAANSSHSKDFCLGIYKDLKLRWPEEAVPDIPVAVTSKFENAAPIIFFDVEVFKNVNIIVYKEIGPDKKCVWKINPKPIDLEPLFQMRLVGFNNRSYDNHILWAIYNGYTPRQVYDLSQEIIVGGNRSPFRDAANLSYTDIWDYCSNKQSLKRWEIDLDIHHLELGWPWDKELPEDMWVKAAEYCQNDVIATEAVWNATQGDFKAREILAEIAGMTVNDTTNQLTTRIIFGDVKEPWHEFNYPDLKAKFPGYRFEHGKSYFHDELIGEGGRVYAQPGMYSNVKTFDVASMHPSSIIAENGFGPYTARFKELMDIRIAIKHKEFDRARKMLDGKLAPYLDDPKQAKQLSQALKIAINSVYGLTAAKFQNKFKDPRNVDNWVAKRGALFMEQLRLDVQKMGAMVVHIKTDSIKVADPTPEVEQFILKRGKEWGYTFEVEDIYERICLVNDAVYIAKRALDDPSWLGECEKAKNEGKPEPTRWTATGAQFQHPYVFKTLFSKEPVLFKDLCETRTVKTDMYLDMNESKQDVSAEEKELEKLMKQAKTVLKEAGYSGNVDQWFEDPTVNSEQKQAFLKRKAELEEVISKGHDYVFVGKAGNYCPIKPGFGGGILLRKGSDGKFASVAGTKGFRWLESEKVKTIGYEQHIDQSYFKALDDAAIDTVQEYGSFDIFVGEALFENAKPKSEELPPWELPCGSKVYNSCSDCPNYYDDQEYCCKLGYNVSKQLVTD